MNALLAAVRRYLAERSPRERWLLVAGGCVAALLFVYEVFVSPLSARAAATNARTTELDGQVTRALQLAAEMRGLQGELADVESRIQPGAKTNLIAVLSTLAQDAKISQEQLESIEPKQPSSNAQYPETRAEVRLKGASLEQAVDFLYRIETSSSHLIVRSLKMRTRGDAAGNPVLDVSFSVSSFERA
ncbi:MAG TPA: type II secretion system protein GspM [Myxococcota bacterium]|nr:type II secretion system protein GspM [Myxococcota bacterium]